MILCRSSRAHKSLVLGSAFALALPFGADLVAFGQSVQGQAPLGAANAGTAVPSTVPAASDSPAANAEVLKQRSRELDDTRAQQRGSAEIQAKLKREIAALGEDRSALNRQLIDTASRVRDIEASIEATRARLNPLDEQESLLRKSLDKHRNAMVEIIAVLQRAGRQPPPAFLVQPQDALKAVRTAIALGAMLPGMRAQADTIAGDLADLARLREQITGERGRLGRDLATLGREQLRLNLLIQERQKKQAEAEQALVAETQRAEQLARHVDNLQDLISKLEASLTPAERAARGDVHGGDATRPDLAVLKDPGRMAPAVAFAATRGHLRLPVNGAKIRDFGAPNGLGGSEKGLSIAAAAGAQITTPCDGWVVYAGPFRGYGQLLILNAGGGYHVLLAGMERISVDLGQFVLTGEPVGVMGSGSQVSAAAAIKSKQPVLYVEFRKDGTPIDPSPWWATNESEKVRG
jgi:murein hydrolase activator